MRRACAARRLRRARHERRLRADHGAHRRRLHRRRAPPATSCSATRRRFSIPPASPRPAHRSRPAAAAAAATSLAYPIDGGDITVNVAGNVLGAPTDQFVNAWQWRVGSAVNGSDSPDAGDRLDRELSGLPAGHRRAGRRQRLDPRRRRHHRSVGLHPDGRRSGRGRHPRRERAPGLRRRQSDRLGRRLDPRGQLRCRPRQREPGGGRRRRPDAGDATASRAACRPSSDWAMRASRSPRGATCRCRTSSIRPCSIRASTSRAATQAVYFSTYGDASSASLDRGRRQRDPQ